MHAKIIKIALLGAPASGKGTQAKLLVKRYGANHVSSGDVLRREVAAATDFGKRIKQFMDKGEIGPAELITEVVLGYLDSLPPNGFVLDGFPRTLYQAETLARRHTLDAAVLIEVLEDRVVARITGRRICGACGSVFHIDNHPPRKAGVCDSCGQALVARNDDNEATVRNRLKVFKEETGPAIDFYASRGLLRTVNGDRAPEEVFGGILMSLKVSNKVDTFENIA